MSSGKKIFISWTHGNPRTRDLGRHLSLDVLFVHRQGNLLLRYVKQALATWKILHEEKPEVLVIMLPPFPLLLIASLYAKVFRRALIADMHTGAFNDPRWKWSLGMTLGLLNGQTAIVTNKFLADICEAKNVKSIVLHDAIEVYESGAFPTVDNTVLCPVSYANDEPINEILKAADETPEVTWIMTGKAPSHFREAAPKNVVFTGFVSDEKFNRLMEESGLVLALTTRPHTMQRAGYEAMSFGVPQVTSDFPELREFLGSAALYTGLTGSEIAHSIRSALERREEMMNDVLRTRMERMTQQQHQLANLRMLIEKSQLSLR